jgi:hypothetical protein
MALSASGAISADDIRTEYGLSGAVSFGDLYRGGTHVRAKAANNNGVNLASSVPTSGAITFGNFRGTAKGFRYTFTAGATNQNASALFGSDYGVNYPKEIVIDSGVELGATSTAEEALEIDSGGAGTITVTNNGTLSGAGGAAGADGGDAFEAAVACIFVNNGTVRAGGGGGGAGGTGGGGSYSSTSYGPENYRVGGDNSYYVRCSSQYGYALSWNNNYINQSNCGPFFNSVFGYLNLARRNLKTVSLYHYYGISTYSTSTSYTSGGSGGSGAVGAGYGQSAGTGSAGSSGGTNAGTGGTGGNGGGFGAAGTAGGTGTNGNYSSGSSGVAGGAAGKYLRGLSFVTFTNNGTVLGGTA